MTLADPAGGAPRDIEIEADVTATVADVADALAEQAGVPAGSELHTDRVGRLDPSQRVGHAGLCSGDIVSVAHAPAVMREEPSIGAGPPVCELRVTGGPGAGTRLGLATGSFVIGRDAGADVVVADASLSRRHLRVTVAPDGAPTVSDEGSSNGTAVEGTGLPEGEERAVSPDDVVEAGRSTFRLGPWRAHDSRVVSVQAGRVSFNRPPRVTRGYEPPTLRIEPPPNAARHVRIPMVVAIIPVFMGLALFLITKSPMMLTMAAFSPLMLIGSSMSERRSSRKEHKEQLERFDRDLEQLTGDLAQARRAEQTERRAVTPDAGDLVGRAVRHLPNLWERRPADNDFLDIRVGTADQPSIVSVNFPNGGDPAQRERVDEMLAQYQHVPVVPVHVRPTEVGAIGLVGDDVRVLALAQWIVTQVVTMQSPRDVVLTAALSPRRADAWRWLDWLPHAHSTASPVDGDHIAVGDRDARELVRALAILAEERRAEGDGRSRTRRRTTVVLVVEEDVAPEGTLVDALLDGCADVEIFVIWLGRERRLLPGGCGVIIEALGDRAAADVTWTSTGRRVERASVDGIPLPIVETVARSLAPVVDTTADGGAAAVPRSVSLVDALDLADPDPEQVAERWAARHGGRLEAVLGVGADGPFSIDLRADGPHALIAGTTGAGKSELLQTLLASLALSHPPERLAFLLVDYKGGAAFKDCKRLPHSVGMVTDLDEHQVRRALISLNAELKRREHILSDHEVRDLMELERRGPDAAPPSLVIVIDEFATLAKEVPEFVDGVVDVAQRGRSLGVHLILATQRPGTAVTENIRANTNLRIALRVAGSAESDDVIDAPDAGRLPRSVPGRAYVKTGPTELELVQVGYVGGRTPRRAARAAVEIHPAPTPFDDGSRGVARAGDAVAGDEVTDLDLVVDAVDAATDRLGIRRPSSPWLPPLSDAVALGALPDADAAEGRAAIGLLDDPARQRQIPYVVDLPAEGSVLVFGGPGTGKTTVLRTVGAALARQSPPRDLQLYGLDFAGRGLAILEGLPHCGSVISGEDQERLERLLVRLRRTIDERSRLFAERRVGSLAEFRAAFPDEPLPRIVVLFDAYAGFTETYDRVDLGALVELVPRLVADGRAAGVHFVITADRRGAVPSSVASLISSRLVLRMGTEDEYSLVGLDARSVRGAVLPAGRGFASDGREVHIATLSGSADGAAEADELAELGVALRGEFGDETAPAVAALPLDIDAVELPAPGAPLVAPFGLDDLDLAPVDAILADSHFLVAGTYRSGRSTALDTITRSLRASVPGLTTHLIAPRRSWLVDTDGWASISKGGDACEARLAELLDETLALELDPTAAPVLIVIDDAGEFAEATCALTLATLLRRGRDGVVRVLASIEQAQTRHYADFIKELRKDGRGLLLDPNLDLDGDVFGVRLPRRSNPAFPPGRGYLVSDGAVRLCQVARVRR